MQYKVPLAFDNIGESEIDAMIAVIRTGRFTEGAEVEKFESAFARYHGRRHAILVNSGSSANLIAIEAAVHLSRLRPSEPNGELRPGDEVIIQGLCWPSTVTPMLNQGLQPVFCDVNMNSLNADVAAVEAVRTSRTRMVIAVPVLGNPAGLDELRAYCERHELLFLEDACESLGAVTESGRRVGTMGMAAAFSFYFSHHVTMIEGGAILTDHAEFADICVSLRSHGWTRRLKVEEFLLKEQNSAIDTRFCFVLPGYNVRSTELNAAIGQVQLGRLDEMIRLRRQVASGRHEAIAAFSDRVTMPGADVMQRHSWMTTPLLFTDLAHRRRAQRLLEGRGIETRPIIVGNLLRQPLADRLGLKAAQSSLPHCDAIFDRGIMIGLNPYSDPATEHHVHAALQAAASA